MKKTIVSIFFLVLYNFSFAQSTMPKYFDVLKYYFITYDDKEDYENYTNFAKKKDGWYVQKINRLQNDKLLEENLFWDLKNKQYQIIPEYGRFIEENKDWENKVESYLQYDWYNYDRINYFGYSTWSTDMIEDFGMAENLSDTMYEGLSRAYNNTALSYLWYQQGGHFNKSDTLQKPLQRLQLPSNERVNKVEENIKKSIESIKKIKNKNYETIIGNASLKVFNEQMNGYNQMFLIGENEKANKYISEINLEEKYILQAKNYLNSCSKNAILFTYGDNDTYQLWYIQQKLNYRKDVIVINTSLLGLASYINQLKTRNEVKILAPLNFISNNGSDVSYFKENKIQKATASYNLKMFLDKIYSRNDVMDFSSEQNSEIINSAYSVKNIRIQKANNSISIKLKNYIYLNDILILDIIQSNSINRDIYFTTNYDTYFENNLLQEGICYKLNFKKNALSEKNEIIALEKYINEIYIPVVSNFDSIPNFILTDGDNVFAAIYAKIIGYYFSKNDNGNAKKWLSVFKSKIENFNIRQVKSLRIAESLLLKVKSNDLAIKILEHDAKYIYEAFKHPDYLIGFYSKKKCEEELRYLLETTQKANLESKLIKELLLEVN